MARAENPVAECIDGAVGDWSMSGDAMRWSPDLAEGRLVELVLEDGWPEGNLLPMLAAHRKDTPPGPAGRWLIERLKDTVSQCPGQESGQESGQE